METLILKGATPTDLQLLLDISKKMGLKLELLKPNKPKTALEIGKEASIALGKTRKPANITVEEIIEECRNNRFENI